MVSFKEYCRLLDEANKKNNSSNDKNTSSNERKNKIKKLLSKDDHWKGLT
jgi:hypothetical protein